jgi:hypothetical protein
MIDFLTGSAIVWLPRVFFVIVFAVAVCAYLNRRRAPDYLEKFSRRLIKITVGFYILYAAFLTWGQYYVWSRGPLGRILLASDRFGKLDGSSGYFLFYAYGRFWLNPIIAIFAAFVFYMFLKSLKKYRERFFEEGETEFGFLCALLAGWPQFTVFLPLVFLGVVGVSTFRLVVLKKRFTTLGYPLIFGLLFTLIWGRWLIDVLSLKALYI